jgi:hypothetical protein
MRAPVFIPAVAPAVVVDPPAAVDPAPGFPLNCTTGDCTTGSNFELSGERGPFHAASERRPH